MDNIFDEDFLKLFKFLKLNINKKENYFFLQKQFLLAFKDKNYKSIFLSKNYLEKKTHEIIDLLNYYSAELVLNINIKNLNNIFREELFEILLFHKNNFGFVYGEEIFLKEKIFYLNGLGDLYFIFKRERGELFLKETMNSFSISIYSDFEEIFGLSFYVGKNEILISNIQKRYEDKKFSYLFPFTKILLNIFILFSKNIGFKKIIGFSDENHPCKSPNISKDFFENYSSRFKKIGMKKQDNYFVSDIEFLKLNEIDDLFKKSEKYFSEKMIKKFINYKNENN